MRYHLCPKISLDPVRNFEDIPCDFSITIVTKEPALFNTWKAIIKLFLKFLW